MKKIGHILTGWAKALGLISTTVAEGKLSVLRLSICGKCPNSKPTKVLNLVNGHAAYENQLACMKCACPCLQKTLVVDEKCPIDRW